MRFKKCAFIPVLAALFAVTGCHKESNDLTPTPSKVTTVEGTGSVHKGSIAIKLQNEVESTDQIANSLPDLEIYDINPMFPEDPRFRERRREAGLHLWYVVSFNPEIQITKAHQEISYSDNIEKVEYIPVVKATSTAPFNDPFLNTQWHYHNTGENDGYVAGADINLYKAWALETGDPSVVVAILDMGVDYKHEDLAANMWINEKEYNGTIGVDDDGNGYKDDIWGYNFLVNSAGNGMQGALYPGPHGTHVAGTVAAVNNNGKFGGGVAGGNGTSPGVRMMSCQTIESNVGAYLGVAFQYAADNGAVITQNSWELLDATSVPGYLTEAIDYFNKYAGTDKNGNQVGPMKGGVTIFAAGNSNKPTGYPAMYEGVIAVASTGPSGVKASYSNYGTWIEISAPGGENGGSPYGNVFSTLPDNQFGGMSGTSMACPHVSGVAALIVSKFGGPGFTNEMLKEKLLSSANKEKLYSVNATYEGKLGVGALDAFAALNDDDGAVPEVVKEISTSVNSNNITVNWKATGNERGSTFAYNLYYSTSDLSDFTPGSTTEGVNKVNVLGGTIEVGGTVSCELKDLEFNTKYYIRIESLSASNIVSGLSIQKEVTTDGNDSPVITPGEDISAILKSFEVKQYEFTISDPNGHSMTFDIQGGSDAVSAKKENDKIIVTIEAYKVTDGDYTAILTVTDTYQGSTSVDIHYRILPNTVPQVVQNISNVLIQKGEEIQIDLNKYITDEDGENLKFSATTSSSVKVVDMSVSENILKLKGNWYGFSTISVTGTDSRGAKASTTFDVLLRDNAVPLDIYPNPVQTTFKIRTAEDVTDASVKVTNISGGTQFSQTGLAIGPFNPYEVDAATWDPGTYVVEVKVGSDITRKNIVKL